MQAGFDVIVMSHVLVHVEDCDAILADLRPLLAPGGRLILLVPHERLRGDVTWHHLVYYSMKHRRVVNPHVRIVRGNNLQKMLSKQGQTIAKQLYINFFPPFTSRIPFWPSAFSLVATCARVSAAPGELRSRDFNRPSSSRSSLLSFDGHARPLRWLHPHPLGA